MGYASWERRVAKWAKTHRQAISVSLILVVFYFLLKILSELPEDRVAREPLLAVARKVLDREQRQNHRLRSEIADLKERQHDIEQYWGREAWLCTRLISYLYTTELPTSVKTAVNQIVVDWYCRQSYPGFSFWEELDSPPAL